MAYNHQKVDLHYKLVIWSLNILSVKCTHMGDFPKFGHMCDCNRFLLGEYYSCPQCPVKQLTSVEETTVLKSVEAIINTGGYTCAWRSIKCTVTLLACTISILLPFYIVLPCRSDFNYMHLTRSV